MKSVNENTTKKELDNLDQTGKVGFVEFWNKKKVFLNT